MAFTAVSTYEKTQSISLFFVELNKENFAIDLSSNYCYHASEIK
jgi:hypothetical protein